MEVNRERFCAMIFYDFRCVINQQQCADQFTSTFGDEAPSCPSVFHWFSEFKRGPTSLQDEIGEGRPKSVVVSESIEAVLELILKDHHVIYPEIEASLGISSTRKHLILHKHLAVKIFCLCWIPHYLTISQKQAYLDCCKNMAEKFDHGVSKDMNKIAKGHETCIYAYEPETKQQSTVWGFQDEPYSTKVAGVRSTSKQRVASFFLFF